MVYSCSKCHKAITEPMVSKCDNRYWHSSCLTCQMCGHTPSMVGEQSMYMFGGSLICKNDYMRINCVCKTCSRPLSQSDMVIKANGYGYMHDKCVFCGRCQHRLETGDRFMLTTDQMIVCQKCIMQQHPQGPPHSLPQQHQQQQPQQAQMVNPAPMGPMVAGHHNNNNHHHHHHHSGPTMGAPPPPSHHHPQQSGHHPPPPQYPHHQHPHSQQLGPPNHHGGHHGPPPQQFAPHSHHPQQSSNNYHMMAPNGYPPTGNMNNGTMNGGMYGHGHHNMGPAGAGVVPNNSNGPTAANGLSRATPPTTPNQASAAASGTNSGGTGNTTTTGGGRRGRKRNTQIKEEF